MPNLSGRNSQVAILMLLFQKPKVLKLIGKTAIAPKGLAGMYIDFIEVSTEEIVLVGLSL